MKINKGNYPLISGKTGKTPKRVVQYSQIGTEIARYDSARIASEAISTPTRKRRQEGIQRACWGKERGGYRSAYGFVWKYEEELYE